MLVKKVQICLISEGSVSILGVDRYVQLSDWEVELFNEVIVNAGEICSAINQGIGVNGF